LHAHRNTPEPLQRATKRASQAKGRRSNPSGHARLDIDRLLVWPNELLNFSVRHQLSGPADEEREKLKRPVFYGAANAPEVQLSGRQVSVEFPKTNNFILHFRPDRKSTRLNYSHGSIS